MSGQNGTVSWHAGNIREACAQTTSKVKVEGETSFDVAHCCNRHVLMRPARPFSSGRYAGNRCPLAHHRLIIEMVIDNVRDAVVRGRTTYSGQQRWLTGECWSKESNPLRRMLQGGAEESAAAAQSTASGSSRWEHNTVKSQPAGAFRTARLRWRHQRRYMKQDTLGYPILVLNTPTCRANRLSNAVQK